MTPLHFPRRAILLWTVAAAIVFGVLHPASAQPNYATPYYFTTLAGNGTEGSIDGTGAAARFAFPNDVAIDASGNVYVALPARPAPKMVSGILRGFTTLRPWRLIPSAY